MWGGGNPCTSAIDLFSKCITKFCNVVQEELIDIESVEIELVVLRSGNKLKIFF
jgi:hypothetical protein